MAVDDLQPCQVKIVDFFVFKIMNDARDLRACELEKDGQNHFSTKYFSINLCKKKTKSNKVF